MKVSEREQRQIAEMLTIAVDEGNKEAQEVCHKAMSGDPVALDSYQNLRKTYTQFRSTRIPEGAWEAMWERLGKGK